MGSLTIQKAERKRFRLPVPSWKNLILLCPFIQPGIAASATAEGSRQPNVILILTDDQGYGDIAAHGNPYISTPNLDRHVRQMASGFFLSGQADGQRV